MRHEPGLRVAITGSAGVGKTTLATLLSERLGVPLIPEEMRAWLERSRGRLEALAPAMAASVLSDLWAVRSAREAAEPAFVADNCATDFAAYALHHGCAEDGRILSDSPLRAAAYDAVFVLPHGAIPYVQDGVRGHSQTAELRYQLLLEGLLRRHVPAQRLHFIPPGCDTPEARVAFCLEVLSRVRVRRSGFVSLVGAGPGNPELLTLRAARLLEEADVVAYDALVAPALIARIGPRAERIPVGHRNQGALQAGYRLHPVVLERARQGLHVVRLKQGDPFIFGRGAEEAEELLDAGIPYEVVPGISAALGAAASAGIPLTHRDYASDVSLVTGHDIEGRKSLTNWERLGAASGTLVLFMATRKLAANLERLVAAGRGPTTPAAYVAAATTPEQVVVVGTLADLAEKVASRNLLGPPALVMVGDVVQLHERLNRPMVHSVEEKQS